MKTFYSRSDTTTYQYQSFFINGILKEEGLVLRSKKEGIWKKCYADGSLKSKISYVNGEIDEDENSVGLPIIRLGTNSLKPEVPVSVKVIHEFACYSGISWEHASIIDSVDKDYMDFMIIPAHTDSVHFYYYDFIDTIILDSVTIAASDITNPSQYGLTDEDLKSIDYFTSVTRTPKKKRLVSFSVDR